MSLQSLRSLILVGFLYLVSQILITAATPQPVPDKVVVLTFDDSVASHHSIVRPLLKQYGFSATFFITEGFSFRTNKKDYMTWEQIAELHQDGFEIGNHTRDHMSVQAANLNQLEEQIQAINQQCLKYGIPRPISFAYPGNAIEPAALPILQRMGIRFARRGGAPEFDYESGRGFAFQPSLDHPLLIPSAGDARPAWGIEDFKRAVHQARDEKIAILQFHGVPDNDHPWVHTPPEKFAAYMDYLHRNGYRVLAMRDLAPFVDGWAVPPDPLAVVQTRKAAGAPRLTLVRGELLDAQSGHALPGRLYVRAENGTWHFPDSAATNGTARLYQVRNWLNTNVVEMHTAFSAHPFEVELPPGRYTFTAQHGKEYFAEIREVTVGDQPVNLSLRLRRWIDLSARGWFSGDTHVHRHPQDLPTLMLAEDLNVAFPMTYWTTEADRPPTRGNKNFKGDFAARPVEVDGKHIYYPVNTEYEIFTTAERSHTLGALLAINHKSVFDLPVLPIRDVAARARAEGALLDLEKHNWPWSMAIVPLVKPDLFELANNHHWETDFCITNWAVPAPAWMNIGSGSGNEREWTLYGFLNYYALLDCGFRINPAAGTAHGVHPVPLGFSRVYVHLPEGFQYNTWVDGLKQGRSFVTTGPMLFATLNDRDPGHVFASPPKNLKLEAHIVGVDPVSEVEIVMNGRLAQTLKADPQRTAGGAWEIRVAGELPIAGSSWIAVRCWEQRTNGRFRFAHTAPWFVEVPGQPLRPRREEVDFLVKRVEEEIARNQNVLSPGHLAEYHQALEAYRAIKPVAR